MSKVIRTVVTIFAIGLFIFSGFQLLEIFAGYRRESQQTHQEAEAYVQTLPKPTLPSRPPAESQSTDPSESQPVPEYAPIQVDFESLLEDNPHVIGWIYGPDSPISYPIVQTENNTDYLRAGLDGSYRHGGTIFLDFRCSGDFSDLNSIVYGHNLLDDTMFGTLEDYKSQGYYSAHRTLYLLTPQADYRLEVIAGLSLDARDALYRTDHTEETYREFLDQVLAASDFQTDFPREEIVRTVSLSTCSYSSDDARYLLVAALIPLDKP
ncbi:MAG: class B sortase [Oscillospiraceae bacterium]|nr:class B sortase [Oscillospiraceae bacterium]